MSLLHASVNVSTVQQRHSQIPFAPIKFVEIVTIVYIEILNPHRIFSFLPRSDRESISSKSVRPLRPSGKKLHFEKYPRPPFSRRYIYTYVCVYIYIRTKKWFHATLAAIYI